jgi:hypothetical protein
LSQGFPPPRKGPPDPAGLNYRGPRSDPLELARRASILLFVLGGLIALVGIGNSTIAYTFSGEELMRQNQTMMPTTLPSGGLGVSASELKIGLVVAGCLESLIGLGLMLLGSPVRRGRLWAITTSIVAASVIGAFALLMLLGSLGFSVIAPALMGVACMVLVPAVLCGLLLKWLLQANNALRSVTMPYAGPPSRGDSALTPPPAWPSPGLPPGGAGPASYFPPRPAGGERPVRYGYAQAPTVPQPPPGDTPIVAALPGSVPPEPAPDVPDGGTDVEKPKLE